MKYKHFNVFDIVVPHLTDLTSFYHYNTYQKCKGGIKMKKNDTLCILMIVFLFVHSNIFGQFAINAGGTQDDRGHGIAKDADGNVYVTGFFTSTSTRNLGGLVSDGGSNDIFIAKYNSSGTFVWAKRMGGSAADVGLDIKVKGSFVYITGYFQGTAVFNAPTLPAVNLTSAGSTEIFLAKYNTSDGTLVWAKRVDGSDQDEGHSIAIDENDNIYLTGYFKTTATFFGTPNISITTPSTFAAFIAKFNSSGDVQYAKLLGGDDETIGNEIVIDGSGNAYVTGTFKGTNDFNPAAGVGVNIRNLTSAGGFDIFFAKYNATGDHVWSERIGAGSDDMGFSLGLDGSNNVYVTGYFQGTADFNPASGAGNVNNLTSAGNKDIFLAKYNSSGVYQWADQIGGSQDDEAFSIAVDNAGNSCITGYFKATADFDPSGSTLNRTSVNNEDTYIARYDNSGAVIFASQIAGSDDIRGRDICTDNSGNCCITGFYNNTADFDPADPINASDLATAGQISSGTGYYKIKAMGDDDIFLTCLSDGALPVELTTFTVFSNDNLAQLNWETATEVNNYGFEVQRSGDGKEWLKVGFVDGHGNSNSPKYYSFSDNSLTSGGTYYYRLKQLDIDGKYEYSDVVNVTLSIPDLEYKLNQNYPNPFNPTTTISYSVPEQAFVKIVIYNTFGEEVQKLESGIKEAGNHTVSFNAQNLASGMYYYMIETEKFVAAKKLLLLK